MGVRTIGQVSKASGVSIRALRHYDEIGLLTPSHRSPSGYRLYDEKDIARLQQVRSLQSMDLSLDQIGELLDGGLSLRDTLERQLESTRSSIVHLEAVAARIAGVLALFETQSIASSETMLELMKEMSMVERHYTKEQMETLGRRAADLGAEGMRAAEAQWENLIDRVRTAKDAGADPTSTEVQEMAAEWQSLIESFTGGDAAMHESLESVWREEQSVGEFDTTEITALAGWMHRSDPAS